MDTPRWSDKSGLKRDGRPETSRQRTNATAPSRFPNASQPDHATDAQGAGTQPRIAWEDSHGRLWQGDVRACLAAMEPESVQVVATSPPFHGLRAYGTEPQIWGGGWQGELGSEPTVEQFIANLVEVFAAVRRVLRDDGTLWINLGSSMAGSGKGPTGHNGIGNAETRQGFHSPGATRLTGWKPKDLIQTPFLLFEALRQDGWYLRSVAPWVKRSGMPESCTDRPTHSLEWIGLFSKSERYFYDAEAGRQPHARIWDATNGGSLSPNTNRNDLAGRHDGNRDALPLPNPAGRNRRNTDWFFDGLDAEIAAAEADLRYLRDLRANGGVRLGDDGLPLAFDVNPQGFAGAHFATWPPNLVKPMIALSTSERGACAACGAPRKRQTSSRYEKSPVHGAGSVVGRHYETGANGYDGAGMPRLNKVVDTIGWAPTCTHLDADVVPCVVCDPFSGSGTTLAVARSLGRFGLGCELQPDYVAMSLKRLRQAVLL